MPHCIINKLPIILKNYVHAVGELDYLIIVQNFFTGTSIR